LKFEKITIRFLLLERDEIADRSFHSFKIVKVIILNDLQKMKDKLNFASNVFSGRLL
jgi:hypothetical protein